MSAIALSKASSAPSSVGTPQRDEAVDVLAAFTVSGVRPLAFRWGGRRYEPLHVHLTHTVREGRKCWRIFSVTDGPASAPEDGNHFALAFDPEDCRWRMWEMGAGVQ